MEPKISVIVPVYNVEKYLRRCVDSIINQTYKNLEIILINDGSKDSSGEICDYNSNMDTRVLVIHQENKGLSEAWNSGLKIVSGNYIGFVDSDDWIKPDMYKTMLNFWS
ncbi:glycosyltransferase [bacterium AH-315-P13]|nr:glycosyltransferase [bacterium AH-315-P13]